MDKELIKQKLEEAFHKHAPNFLLADNSIDLIFDKMVRNNYKGLEFRNGTNATYLTDKYSVLLPEYKYFILADVIADERKKRINNVLNG
jgi:hypothetical protein